MLPAISDKLIFIIKVDIYYHKQFPLIDLTMNRKSMYKSMFKQYRALNKFQISVFKFFFFTFISLQGESH